MKRTTYIAGWNDTCAGGDCTAQSGSLGDYARAARKENKPTATKVLTMTTFRRTAI